MEGVKTFLESSSIGGLNHIATSKKFARLFWILAVVAGFSGAVFLIQLSFQSWSLSPVKTTIETLPLSRITLPKVTVCPPKNTFTDLNYDLMRAEEMGLEDGKRNQLFEMALGLLESKNFEKNWAIWNKVQEKNRFFNWYHKLTVIRTPYYTECHGTLCTKYVNILLFDVVTSAPDGVVTSQYFGEKFQLNKLEKKVHCLINIVIPAYILSYPNVTLHVKFEQTPGLNHSIKDDEGNIKFDLNNTLVYTPVDNNIYAFYIERNIEDEDLDKMNLLSMPGFQFSWYISGAEVTPERLYKLYPRMKQFIRFN